MTEAGNIMRCRHGGYVRHIEPNRALLCDVYGTGLRVTPRVDFRSGCKTMTFRHNCGQVRRVPPKSALVKLSLRLAFRGGRKPPCASSEFRLRPFGTQAFLFLGSMTSLIIDIRHRSVDAAAECASTRPGDGRPADAMCPARTSRWMNQFGDGSLQTRYYRGQTANRLG